MRFRSRGSRAIGLVDRQPVAVQVPPAERGVPPDDLAAPASRRRAPGARGRSWRPAAAPTSPCRAGGRSPRAPRRPARTSGPPRPFSAFTSVPVQLPGAGCTTIPAGLSTTSTSSSSYAIARGISSADHRPRGRRRDLDDDRARPPRGGSSRARRRPSTSTCPLAISVAACGAREVERRGDEQVEPRRVVGGDQLVPARRWRRRRSLPRPGHSGRRVQRTRRVSCAAAFAAAVSRSSRDSDQASTSAPTVTAESATLKVQKRTSPTPMSMKSTTPLRRAEPVDEIARRAAEREPQREHPQPVAGARARAGHAIQPPQHHQRDDGERRRRCTASTGRATC